MPVKKPGKYPIHAVGVMNDTTAAYEKTNESPIRNRRDVNDILFTPAVVN